MSLSLRPISKDKSSTSSYRSALKDISLNSNNDQFQKNYLNNFIGQKKQKQSTILDQKDKQRIIELKNKYQNYNSIQESDTKKQKNTDNEIDQSFKVIEIHKTTHKEDKQNCKINFPSKFNQDFLPQQRKNLSKMMYSLHQKFQKQIQQSDFRIESNLQRVQRKIQSLKRFRKEECGKNKYRQLNQKIAKKDFQQERTNDKFNISKLQKTPQQSSWKKQQMISNQEDTLYFNEYARQLRNKNFMDQMKRKIQEIQSQRKSNIQKRLSQFTQSKASSHKQKYQQIQSQQKDNFQENTQKLTLKSLTPHLAESQIIQTTERQRFTDRSFQGYNQLFSKVIEKYELNKDQNSLQTKILKLGDQIVQEPDLEQELSVKASPYRNKNLSSPSKLQQTQLVERNSLKGDFQNIDHKTQKQFTLLINRLAQQAEIDTNFSSEIFKFSHIILPNKQNLKSILISIIKNYCHQNNIAFDQRQFQVNQMEIDPLLSIQKNYQDLSQQEIENMAYSLKKNCDKIHAYYVTKIYQSFHFQTVNFLIQQLRKCHSLNNKEPFNAGHLTSYINMRTGKNLRNRNFYRIMKRILYNNGFSSTFTEQNLIQSLVRKDQKHLFQ